MMPAYYAAEGGPQKPPMPPLTDQDQKRVLVYLNLVKKIVSSIMGTLPQHLRSEDLMHSGIMGLIEAVQRFPWGRENEQAEFEAYAQCRIRGSVKDELRRLDALPRSVRREVRNYRLVNNRLRHELKREPSDQEMADSLQVSLETCRQLRAETHYGQHVSYDRVITGSNGDQIMARPMMDESARSPEGMMHEEEVKLLLAREIDRLREQEKQVISLYYLEEMKLKEIGTILSVTEARVSQIHSQAVVKLRQRLKTVLGIEIDLEEIR